MSFLGDLFAPKGTVETKTQVTGIPSGMKARHKLGFVPVRPGAKAPRTPPPETRWSAFSEDYRQERTLPAGHWQIVVQVVPVAAGGKADPSRAVPFWPLSAAIEVKKGETTRVQLDVAFPKAGLPSDANP